MASVRARTKKVDIKWADIALRSDRIGDYTIKGRRGGRRPERGTRPGMRSATETATARDGADNAVEVEVGGIDWDSVVDIVCIGRGAGALAVAIGGRRDGMKVFIADAGHATEADSLAARLGVADAVTVDYLNALTEDVGPLIRCAVPSRAPLRMLDGPQTDPGRRRIATFVGSALRGWADRCLASPYGLLYTSFTHSATVTYSSAGESIEASVVGTIDVENGRLCQELDQWLAARAGELGVDEDSSDSLQRLVFDGGQVVGAVIDTPDGPRAVRARRGVVMETGGSVSTPLPAEGLDDASSVVVALVSRAASRFVRLELLATPR